MYVCLFFNYPYLDFYNIYLIFKEPITDNEVKLSINNVMPIVCQCLSKLLKTAFFKRFFMCCATSISILVELRELELETEV